MLDSNIVITGSSGFVGFNLIKYFEKQFVQPIYKLTRVELEQIQQCFPENAETVVHLAGKAHDLEKTSNPKEYYQVNFELTQKLYDAFLNSNAKKFIFVSSVKAASDAVDQILTENVIPDPKTHYGKSKLMAEQYIQSKPLPVGKSYYILRPCMIHGPGNKGNLNLLYQFIKKGIPYPLACFNNKRSFLSIENFCYVIKELVLTNKITSGVYNVADDEALSTNEVVMILSTLLNKKPRLWRISPRLVTSMAKVGDYLHLPLTSERLSKLTENYVVSNAKMKEAINKKLPIKAAEGLQITASYFSKT